MTTYQKQLTEPADNFTRAKIRLLRDAQRRTHTNSSAHGTYTGSEITTLALRPGANDFLRLPSRIGNTLHYRDGRTDTTTHGART